MKKLEKTIRKNGYEYKLHTRGKRAAIYEQWGKTSEGKDRLFAYEVFEIKTTNEKFVFNTTYPAQERFPANEDFGKSAWSIFPSEEDRAIEIFQGLEG